MTEKLVENIADRVGELSEKLETVATQQAVTEAELKIYKVIVPGAFVLILILLSVFWGIERSNIGARVSLALDEAGITDARSKIDTASAAVSANLERSTDAMGQIEALLGQLEEGEFPLVRFGTSGPENWQASSSQTTGCIYQDIDLSVPLDSTTTVFVGVSCEKDCRVFVGGTGTWYHTNSFEEGVMRVYLNEVIVRASSVTEMSNSDLLELANGSEVSVSWVLFEDATE